MNNSDRESKENCNEVVLTNSLEQSINNIIEKEDFIRHDVYKRKLYTEGGNFLGSLYEVDIKGETKDYKKEINLFIKQAVKLNKIKIISVDEVFSKEAFIYNELSEVFADLQTKYNVHEHERFKIMKSYGCSSDGLILENLSHKGFKTYYRMDVPPLKYVELSIKELARFHGLSLVVEHKMPEYFNKAIKPFKQPYAFDDDWEQFTRNICLGTANLLPDILKRKLKDFVEEEAKRLRKHYLNEKNLKSSLCHGDYRINNVLVKEINGIPVEVMPVDYQLIHYGNPIKDFFYFIYTGTDREFRKKYLGHLKELYFETLAQFLDYFEMDIENTFSRKEFEYVYSETLDYGLVKGLYASWFVFTRDESLDCEVLSLSELPFVPHEKYTERAKGIIEDYVELGFL